ncbi:MAG: hypothetical protein [Bacteriophage sp.]|nr:MAG: hypothetical protein [Bacteriophage sp.]
MAHFKRLNEKPMVKLILEHLKNGKSITSIEANALWRCRSLSRRICDIEKLGYKVARDNREDVTGQTYTRYSLVADPS